MLKTALIPAAGRGARLDRVNMPKPLVSVGGQALIVRTMEGLSRAGVERFVIVVGYEGRRVEQALRVHPALESLLTSDRQIEFVQHGDWKRGLASSILAARAHISEPFLIAMADHVFDPRLLETAAGIDLADDAVAVMADRQLDQIYDLPSAVKLSCRGERIEAAGFDIDPADAVDIGLMAASLELFDALEQVDPANAASRGEVDLSKAVHRLARQGVAKAVWTEGQAWFDIDTPPAAVRAEMALRARRRRETHRKLNLLQVTGPTPTTYNFVTGAPATSAVHVRRGLVREPHVIPLIPEACASSPHFVMTDEHVKALYADTFLDGLRKIGYDVHLLVLPDGEEAKTLRTYTSSVEYVLSKGIDERSVLISLGGGAVCNVCGFIASTLYRGIGLAHIPTTLMAQCDAAISHKQAVNSLRGKNLIGSYYPPLCIGVDVEVLDSLDDALIPDGLSEVVKHALGQDAGYIDSLMNYQGNIRDLDFLESVVEKNIELKCILMRDDPKEHREAMVLQYGHTVGHPLEYLSGFELNHGQAVAIGMMVAVRVARIMGACGEDMIDLHRSLISKYTLPTRIPASIDAKDIMNMLRYNKRYLSEGTRMALVNGPGSLWSVDERYDIPVPDEDLRQAIEASY